MRPCRVVLVDVLALPSGAGDVLLGDAGSKSTARPGTSIHRPLTEAGSHGASRSMTSGMRPATGFARPGTASRQAGNAPGTAQQRVATALRGNRPGTSRPTTNAGRFMRLGTASLASQAGGPFINVDKLNMDKYAKRPHLAHVLCDFLLYNESNPKVASALCAAALVRHCLVAPLPL